MTEDEAYKVHIQYTFNAFCKVVIRHAAIDIILKLRRRWEREVSLDYLMNEKFVQLAEPEQLEEYLFTVCGQTAVLYHAELAAALPARPEHPRSQTLFMASHLQFLCFFPLRRFLLLFLLGGFELRPDGRLFLFLRGRWGCLGFWASALAASATSNKEICFPALALASSSLMVGALFRTPSIMFFLSAAAGGRGRQGEPGAA